MRHAQTASRVLTPLFAAWALTWLLTGTAHADRVPLVGSGATVRNAHSSFTPSSSLIVPVDPDSVPCPQSATFTDVLGGEPPGTNYDGVVQSGGLLFAERFKGQTVGYSGDFDVVSGNPTNPLSLQAGSPGQNLDVFAYTTNVLAGLGPLGFPDFDAIGEGAIAMVFPLPQSRVSFQIVGGNGGSGTLGFYRADGSLIDNVVVSGLGEFGYGFATSDGSRSIAGILIQSTDPSGIGVVDICHDGGLVNSRTVTWRNIKRLYR